MREIDKQTMDGIGIPGIVLMENAGAVVARKISEKFNTKKEKIIILAGHGNNGGDGFVIARHLANKGYEVETWFIGDIRKSSEESVANFHSLVHSGFKIKFWNEENDPLLKERLEYADVIVDALLGTGASGSLREPVRNIVNSANSAKGFKIAVDMPTGVNATSGEVVDIAFKADLTVTFALPKIGQFLYPGAEYTGKLHVADISIPRIVSTSLKINKHLITEQMVKDMLPVRRQNTHKGSYGHALIIGGSKGMPGAPTLSTLAALRTGAGLTTVMVPESLQPMVFSHTTEAICIGLPETQSGHFSAGGFDYQKLSSGNYSAIGIGPGLGRWEKDRDFLDNILKASDQPLVIDADGLNILSEDLKPLLSRNGITVLTPHPGEMARLIKKDVAFVEKNRVLIASDLAQEYRTFMVLKGANTIIATPDGEIYINATGGPELAKGGTGDVLTGMITGLLAQKLPALDSIIIGVYLHGLAGSLASFPSNYSTLATEIIDNIGKAINHTMSNYAN